MKEPTKETVDKLAMGTFPVSSQFLPRLLHIPFPLGHKTQSTQVTYGKIERFWENITFQFVFTDLFYINFINSNNDLISVFLNWQFLRLSFHHTFSSILNLFLSNLWVYSTIEQNKIKNNFPTRLIKRTIDFPLNKTKK